MLHGPADVLLEIDDERLLLAAEDLAHAERGHLDDTDPSGHGLRDAFHELVHLAASEDVHAGVVACLQLLGVHDTLYDIEEAGGMLNLVNNHWSGMETEEHLRILDGDGPLAAIGQGDVAEAVLLGDMIA